MRPAETSRRRCHHYHHHDYSPLPAILLSSWCFGLLLVFLSSPPSAYASPSLSKVENRTKQYFYTSYPPGNPLVRLTRTIKVKDSGGKLISYANIIMYNTTVEDYLEVPASRLTDLGLTATFYPQEGMAQLLITGNRTANTYQKAMRYVKFQAPISYLKTAEQTRMWRNVTFQVVNVQGQASNTVMRPVRLDAAWKVLTEAFPGILDDKGKKNMFM